MYVILKKNSSYFTGSIEWRLLRIEARTPALLTGFLGFSQFLQAKAGILPRLSHVRFLSNSGNWPVGRTSGCKPTSSRQSGIKYTNPNVIHYMAVFSFSP
jgi:hypothetical protein